MKFSARTKSVTRIQDRSGEAFTFLELLVVVAIVTLLALVSLPAFASTKSNAHRINCSDNLKRVGVAFRAWAANHDGRPPTFISSSQGGAAQAVGTRAIGASFNSNLSKGVFTIFAVMSNELTTPKILYCPAEYRANIAQGSIFGDTVGPSTGFFSDNGTSYFVGVDASDFSPRLLQSGDHNLGDGLTPPLVTYGDGKGNFIAAGTNVFWSSAAIGWADNQHRRQGNVLFADGSVLNLTTDSLHEALNKTGDTPRTPGAFTLAVSAQGSGINRLQFP